MNLTGLLSKMLMLFLFLCIGILCSKTNIIDQHGSTVINKIVLYICTPALTIYSVLTSGPDFSIGDVLMLLVYAFAFNLLALLLGWFFSIVFCRRREERGTFHLVTAFGNVAFMGYPVVSAVYGSSAIFLASVCTMPFNLFLYSIGGLLVSENKEKGIPWRKAFFNPAVISTLIAMAFFFLNVSLPAVLTDSIAYLANMVVPLSMIVIGSSLGRMKAKSVLLRWQYYAVSLCKLILFPLILFFLFRIFIHDQMLLGLLFILALMPTAAMTSVLSAEYGGDSDFANGSIFISTVLSLATVPLMIFLFLL